MTEISYSALVISSIMGLIGYVVTRLMDYPISLALLVLGIIFMGILISSLLTEEEIEKCTPSSVPKSGVDEVGHSSIKQKGFK